MKVVLKQNIHVMELINEGCRQKARAKFLLWFNKAHKNDGSCLTDAEYELGTIIFKHGFDVCAEIICNAIRDDTIRINKIDGEEVGEIVVLD